ncbi:MAG: hypothetical protein HC853_03335, partial [Anaerolineae bacterium]|nr:hypothetical protein [Anaerolineae bacterium]
MSDAISTYRCRSCKTRVTMAMSICPICGEAISPQTALLSAGSSTRAKMVLRHNSATEAAATTAVASAPEAPPQPEPPPAPAAKTAKNASLQEVWDEMTEPKTPQAVYAYASPLPTPAAKARNGGRSFAVYVACVVMVLVGSFLIGIGLARRYTA